MVGEPAVVGRSSDAQDGSPGASGELNPRIEPTPPAATCDRYRLTRATRRTARTAGVGSK